MRTIEQAEKDCRAAWAAQPEATHGWCIHHGQEWEELCEPIAKRIAYILSEKPKSEQVTRLDNMRPMSAASVAIVAPARKAYNEAMATAEKAYDEAKAHERRKAYRRSHCTGGEGVQRSHCNGGEGVQRSHCNGVEGVRRSLRTGGEGVRRSHGNGVEGVRRSQGNGVGGVRRSRGNGVEGVRRSHGNGASCRCAYSHMEREEHFQIYLTTKGLHDHRRPHTE